MDTAVSEPASGSSGGSAPAASVMEMISALDDADYPRLLVSAAKASPEVHKLIADQYSKLFNLDSIQAEYSGWLAKRLPSLLPKAADDSIEQVDVEDDSSLTGETVGAKSVREALRHVKNTMFRWEKATAWQSILLAVALLLQDAFDPKWLNPDTVDFEYNVDGSDDRGGSASLGAVPPICDIEPVVRWINECLELANDAALGLDNGARIDDRVVAAWQRSRDLVTKVGGDTSLDLAPKASSASGAAAGQGTGEAPAGSLAQLGSRDEASQAGAGEASPRWDYEIINDVQEITRILEEKKAGTSTSSTSTSEAIGGTSTGAGTKRKTATQHHDTHPSAHTMASHIDSSVAESAKKHPRSGSREKASRSKKHRQQGAAAAVGDAKGQSARQA